VNLKWALNYTIDAKDRTAFSEFQKARAFALPPSFWFPWYNTPYGEHGADTAPFALTVAVPLVRR
jgi:hypothetical protein